MGGVRGKWGGHEVRAVVAVDVVVNAGNKQAGVGLHALDGVHSWGGSQCRRARRC